MKKYTITYYPKYDKTLKFYLKVLSRFGAEWTGNKSEAKLFSHKEAKQIITNKYKIEVYDENEN